MDWNRRERLYTSLMEVTTLQINGEKGLTDDWIRCITQDKDFNIWIATVSGISKLTPTNYAELNFTIRNFRQENGLPG